MFILFTLLRILGPQIRSGVLSVPCGIHSSLTMSGQTDQILPTDSPIRVIEGAKDNLPDESSLKAAKEIATLASSLGQGDLLFVLVNNLA
jgi:glycerate 2-kinase